MKLKYGIVTEVDVTNGTARIEYSDTKLISARMPIIIQTPLIELKAETDGTAWGRSAEYSTVNRSLNFGEEYSKSGINSAGVEATLEYKKTETLSAGETTCALSGKIEDKTHKIQVSAARWFPFIGQRVAAIVDDNGDGIIIGGI